MVGLVLFSQPVPCRGKPAYILSFLRYVKFCSLFSLNFMALSFPMVSTVFLYLTAGSLTRATSTFSYTMSTIPTQRHPFDLHSKILSKWPSSTLLFHPNCPCPLPSPCSLSPLLFPFPFLPPPSNPCPTPPQSPPHHWLLYSPKFQAQGFIDIRDSSSAVHTSRTKSWWQPWPTF